MIEVEYTEALEVAFARDDAGEVFSDHQIVIEATDKRAVHVVYTGGDQDFWNQLVRHCRHRFSGVSFDWTKASPLELWFPRH